MEGCEIVPSLAPPKSEQSRKRIYPVSGSRFLQVGGNDKLRWDHCSSAEADVLCPGSDDELDMQKLRAKRRRIVRLGRSFLTGTPLVISSAQLRGSNGRFFYDISDDDNDAVEDAAEGLVDLCTGIVFDRNVRPTQQPIARPARTQRSWSRSKGPEGAPPAHSQVNTSTYSEVPRMARPALLTPIVEESRHIEEPSITDFLDAQERSHEARQQSRSPSRQIGTTAAQPRRILPSNITTLADEDQADQTISSMALPPTIPTAPDIFDEKTSEEEVEAIDSATDRAKPSPFLFRRGKLKRPTLNVSRPHAVEKRALQTPEVSTPEIVMNKPADSRDIYDPEDSPCPQRRSSAITGAVSEQVDVVDHVTDVQPINDSDVAEEQTSQGRDAKATAVTPALPSPRLHVAPGDVPNALDPVDDEEVNVARSSQVLPSVSQGVPAHGEPRPGQHDAVKTVNDQMKAVPGSPGLARENTDLVLPGESGESSDAAAQHEDAPSHNIPFSTQAALLEAHRDLMHSSPRSPHLSPERTCRRDQLSQSPAPAITPFADLHKRLSGAIESGHEQYQSTQNMLDAFSPFQISPIKATQCGEPPSLAGQPISRIKPTHSGWSFDAIGESQTSKIRSKLNASFGSQSATPKITSMGFKSTKPHSQPAIIASKSTRSSGPSVTKSDVNKSFGRAQSFTLSEILKDVSSQRSGDINIKHVLSRHNSNILTPGSSQRGAVMDWSDNEDDDASLADENDRPTKLTQEFANPTPMNNSFALLPNASRQMSLKKTGRVEFDGDQTDTQSQKSVRRGPCGSGSAKTTPVFALRSAMKKGHSLGSGLDDSWRLGDAVDAAQREPDGTMDFGSGLDTSMDIDLDASIAELSRDVLGTYDEVDRYTRGEGHRV